MSRSNKSISIFILIKMLIFSHNCYLYSALHLTKLIKIGIHKSLLHKRETRWEHPNRIQWRRFGIFKWESFPFSITHTHTHAHSCVWGKLAKCTWRPTSGGTGDDSPPFVFLPGHPPLSLPCCVTGCQPLVDGSLPAPLPAGLWFMGPLRVGMPAGSQKVLGRERGQSISFSVPPPVREQHLWWILVATPTATGSHAGVPQQRLQASALTGHPSCSPLPLDPRLKDGFSFLLLLLPWYLNIPCFFPYTTHTSVSSLFFFTNIS